MTREQRVIFDFVQSKGQATKSEICEVADGYYCNGNKHVGDRLTRMVKARLLVRIKKGVYACWDCKTGKPENESQTELFV